MRAGLVVTTLFLLVACGDGAADSGGSTASATSGTSGTSGTSETVGTGDSTGASASGSGSTDGTSASGSGSESTGGTTGGETSCLSDELLAALDQHVHDLTASAELLAGHPSANEVTGFLHSPGLPEPPAVVAQFAGPLVMTCSEPLTYDPYCEEGRCSQIECTGAGAGWISHLWVETAVVAGDWSIDAATVDIRWDEGDSGTTFEIAATSTGPGGTDMAMVGDGAMGTDGFNVTQTYAAMHPAGPAVLSYADDANGFVGQLAITDVVVATVDPAGHLQPTGDCP